MNRPARIVLIGFSGTGKSAVALLVADTLRWEAIDTDTLVELEAGKPVAEVFLEEGEERFRKLESEALKEACSHERVVVAAGGGAVLRPQNRRLMERDGFVVCLEARPETILRRLQGSAGSAPLDRPLLARADPLARIRDLKTSRQPLYTLCDGTVYTDELSLGEVAAQIVQAFEQLADGTRTDPGRQTEGP